MQYADDAAQDRGIVPDAELDLNGGDLGDASRFFDLADGDVGQADAGDQAIAFQRGEGPDARRQRRARIRHVQLIERDAIDAERTTASFARCRKCFARPSGSQRPSGRVMPPLVATVIRDRSPGQVDSARAISRSLCPMSRSSRQYASAVSSSVTPASNAACSTSTERSSSRSGSVERRMPTDRDGPGIVHRAVIEVCMAFCSVYPVRANVERFTRH